MKIISTPVIVKNTNVIEETIIKSTKENKKTTIKSIIKEPKIVEIVEKTIPINNVQNAPVFKGCEGLSEEENRKCFERKIQRHVQRHFNSEIAQDVGLSSGKYKILTQFIINKSGIVSDIKIRAPHKKLEKETNKVVRKIPNFTPGKQNKKAVKVKYTLPITFKVE
ncbi:energy transducer TonB [Tenacibaculum pacificus]|uniref:energy transducer TonB n=1 Tax=Tenacibaculum pacificus TaxID=3018314 RepID=UPI0022F3B6AD|nr:energy transducer TonB [Tenacibaculum pacificus]WBX73833.1 energy transducer TonB [Tenacibaculum pacificus]